jgi:quercetin dioxygenase-like cupin family protein
MMRTALALAFIVMTTVASPALAQTDKPAQKPPAPQGSVVTPAEVKWGDIPAAFITGTPQVAPRHLQVAVIQGDPAKAGGVYTLRLKCEDGEVIAPHWHPTAEHVTVLQGTFALGMGSTYDASKMQELGTGSFATAPARMRHFAACHGENILQVHGVGPFHIYFVSAAGAKPAPPKQAGEQ